MTTATLPPTAGETTLTPDQLADRLMNQAGTTFATLTTRTDARCRKTANPFGTVYKTSRVNVALGTDYAAGVNRQRGREDNEEAFTAQARQWGTVLAGCVVEHKGKLYLRCKVERHLARHYKDAVSRSKKVVRNLVQHSNAGRRTQPRKPQKTSMQPQGVACFHDSMGDTGLEPVTSRV